MTVETAANIGQLDPTQPLFDGPVVEGDDHIRLLKTVIRNDALSKAAGGTVAALLVASAGLTAAGVRIGTEGVNHLRHEGANLDVSIASGAFQFRIGAFNSPVVARLTPAAAAVDAETIITAGKGDARYVLVAGGSLPYLPLTGGTLTGLVTGTIAKFGNIYLGAAPDGSVNTVQVSAATASAIHIRSGISTTGMVVFRNAANSTVAYIDPSGTAMTGGATVVTQEKGDYRYSQLALTTLQTHAGPVRIGNFNIGALNDGSANASYISGAPGSSFAVRSGITGGSGVVLFSFRDAAGTVGAYLDSVGTAISSSTLSIITAQKGDARYAELSGAVMTGMLTAPSATIGAFEINLQAGCIRRAGGMLYDSNASGGYHRHYIQGVEITEVNVNGLYVTGLLDVTGAADITGGVTMGDQNWTGTAESSGSALAAGALTLKPRPGLSSSGDTFATYWSGTKRFNITRAGSVSTYGSITSTAGGLVCATNVIAGGFLYLGNDTDTTVEIHSKKNNGASPILIFRDGAANQVARVDLIGTAANQPTSMITREKGDLRYQAASSQRYKSGLAPRSQASLLAVFDALVPSGWVWGGEMPDTDERYGMPGVGFGAEDIEPVFPEAVRYQWVPNGMDANGDPMPDATKRPNALDPMALIAVLHAKIAQQDARIAALEAV